MAIGCLTPSVVAAQGNPTVGATVSGAEAPQVTILSPVDEGTLTDSPLQSVPHHTFGGDWAADIGGTGAAYARFENPSGDLVLTMEEQYDPCGVPNSGGLAVVIGVSVGGTRVGSVNYLHLASVEVAPGVIPNGARLGEMIIKPPVQSGCWGSVHTHIEPRNEKKAVTTYSCFVTRNLNTWVDFATPVGVLGGDWVDRPNQACPPGVEYRPPGGGAPVTHDPVGRLTSAARVAGGARLLGWARDPDTRRVPVSVEALVDGQPGGRATAGTGEEFFPPTFDFVVPVDEGGHQICVRALGQGGGGDAVLPSCMAVPATGPVSDEGATSTSPLPTPLRITTEPGPAGGRAGPARVARPTRAPVVIAAKAPRPGARGGPASAPSSSCGARAWLDQAAAVDPGVAAAAARFRSAVGSS